MKKQTILTRELSSSAIAKATYERDTFTLIITFRSGKDYAYPDVPEATYRGLVRASSAGRYFNKRIRDQYSLA